MQKPSENLTNPRQIVRQNVNLMRHTTLAAHYLRRITVFTGRFHFPKHEMFNPSVVYKSNQVRPRKARMGIALVACHVPWLDNRVLATQVCFGHGFAHRPVPFFRNFSVQNGGEALVTKARTR